MPTFWSPGGPHIPDEVVRALEDERLVLFCGAGLSMAAGLPDFGGLVAKLFEKLNRDAPPEGDKQWDWPDRLLGELERDHRDRFRETLTEVLSREPDTLDPHKAVLRLARSRNEHRRIRLVTTNFDLYFEAAARSLGCSLQEHEGSALPVPKKDSPYDWASVAYLHGKLNLCKANSHLVITSADFGRAYLREGWAARFVTHLFSSFSVLFVGYSLNDPVLRYIVDAFAADRAAGRVPHQAYALAEGNSGNTDCGRQWTRIGITPIFYDGANRHRALHETLRVWADWHDDMLGAKERAIYFALQAPGTGPTTPDAAMTPDARENLLWALSGGGPADAIGAAILANRANEAPGHWITLFEEHDARVGNPDGVHRNSHSATLLAGLTSRTVGAVEPSAAEEQMARWIVAHLNDESVLAWARRCWNNGKQIGTLLRSLIRQQLRSAPPSDAFATLWRLLAAEALQPQAVSIQLVLEVLHFLRQSKPSLEWSDDLCWLLEPVLILDDPIRTPRLPASEPAISELTSPRIELRLSRFVPSVSRNNPPWLEPVILGAMTDQLTALLGRALKLWAALGRASRESDPGVGDLRLLGAPTYLRKADDWILLADLLWDGWKYLDSRSPAASRALIGHWRAQHYPMFRGLALMAVTTSEHWDADEKVGALIDEIASPGLDYQVLPLLAASWPDASPERRRELIEAILAMEPVSAGADDLQRARERRDYCVWLRLEKIEQSLSGSLPGEVAAELTRLRTTFTDFSLAQFEQAGLPRLPGTAFAPLPVSYSPAESACGRTDEDMLSLLRRQASNTGIAVIDWQTSWQKCPDCVFHALDLATEHEIDPIEMWTGAVRGVPGSLDAANAAKLFTALQGLPASLWAGIALLRDASRCLAENTQWGSTDLPTEGYWALWDSLIAKATAASVANYSDDPFTNAVLNPSGALAEALMSAFRATQPQRQQLLDVPWRARFDALAGNDRGLRPARVVIGFHLAFLHAVDRKWAVQTLLEHMNDWTGACPEAPALWNALGRGLRLDSELWRDLKEFFKILVRCDHLNSLRRDSRRNLLYVPVALATSVLDLETAITDTRPILGALSNTDRDEVAAWIRWVVDGIGRAQRDGDAQAQARVDDLVGRRLMPWLEGVWPQQQNARTDRSTSDLIHVALACGSIFPDVIRRMKPFLGRLSAPFEVLMSMQNSRHPDEHPAALLELLDHVADPRAVVSGDFLYDIFTRMKCTDPQITSDQKFHNWGRRLRELRMMRGG